MSAADNRQDVDTNVETCSQQMVTRYLPRGAATCDDMSTSDRIHSNIATQCHRDVNNNIYIFYSPDKDSGQYLVFSIYTVVLILSLGSQWCRLVCSVHCHVTNTEKFKCIFSSN